MKTDATFIWIQQRYQYMYLLLCICECVQKDFFFTYLSVLFVENVFACRQVCMYVVIYLALCIHLWVSLVLWITCHLWLWLLHSFSPICLWFSSLFFFPFVNLLLKMCVYECRNLVHTHMPKYKHICVKSSLLPFCEYNFFAYGTVSCFHCSGIC